MDTVAWQSPSVQPPIRVDWLHSLRSVRGPGIAAMVLIGLVGLLDVVDLPLLARIWSLFEQLVDGVDVPMSDLDQLDDLRASFGWLQVACYVAAGVVFLVWFYRVRCNAGVLNPGGQRRRQGWAIGGWFCPVVNLWFPLQIMVDAVRSAPAAGRRLGTLTGWWWALWLADLLLGRIVAMQDPQDPSQYRTWLATIIAMDAAGVASAVLAILLVGRLTALQQNVYLQSPSSLPTTTW